MKHTRIAGRMCRRAAALLGAVVWPVVGGAGDKGGLAEQPLGLETGQVPELWQQRASPALAGRAGNTAVWTGEEMIVFGGEGMGVSFGDGARYDPARNSWRRLPTQGQPSSRTGHSAVWTGREMVIWGGFGGTWGHDIRRNDGGRYDPVTDTWRPVSTRGAPLARFDHSAVWTGKEMLVWGGYTDSHARYGGARVDAFLSSGGRYNPQTDTWRPITRQGAPSARCWNSAVWTGTEMIIWGGGNAHEAFNDGARYDPETDTWKPMLGRCPLSPRASHLAIWMGNPTRDGCPGGDMLVWGGANRDDTPVYFQDGARYNPATDSWSSISSAGAPLGRVITRAVWTGSEMLFWGGVNDSESRNPGDLSRYVGSGGGYNPATDSWRPIGEDGAPTPRLVTAAVWTGTSLLLSGGYNGAHRSETYSYSLSPLP